MNKQLVLLATALFVSGASAQFQFNPQAGINFQSITNPGAGIEYKANVGWQLGADLRFGNRLFFQPGAHFGRSSTAYKAINNDTLLFENDLVRTNLKLNALVGYRIIDSYQFDLRFMAGPTYDVLLSVDNRNDQIGYNRGDFRTGSFNLDAALGFDMGLVTVQPGVSFGLSRVFKDNPTVQDIGSRYLSYGVTIGINLGDDDK
ncbi:MAG: outer membrane beta-barrel protein [Flavobacteriales bacterium]|nr:outer membrane beta-barrel protein [Flavobacteriales bacterium]